MKPEYLLLWFASGVVVILGIRAALFLKKVCEARHDAEHEEFYQFLLHPENAPVPAEGSPWFASARSIKVSRQLLSAKFDA